MTTVAMQKDVRVGDRSISFRCEATDFLTAMRGIREMMRPDRQEDVWSPDRPRNPDGTLQWPAHKVAAAS